MELMSPDGMSETYYLDIAVYTLMQVMAAYGVVLSFAIYQDGLTRLHGQVEPV